MADEKKINALGKEVAYNLADITKTRPQFRSITPRWLTKLLEFKGLESGIYRVNKVVEGDTPLDVLCSSEKKSDIIPQGYVEYELKPREYILNSISTIINVNTAVQDVYSSPYDQAKEQLSRTPRKLPTMKMNPDVKDLFEFKFEDFELTDYDPWPTIKAPIAV